MWHFSQNSPNEFYSNSSNNKILIVTDNNSQMLNAMSSDNLISASGKIYLRYSNKSSRQDNLDTYKLFLYRPSCTLEEGIIR